MKKSAFVIPAILFMKFTASAQVVNKDSLSLVSRINADKEKLARLQSSVEDKISEKKKTAEKAQESADDNRKAANKLSSDPQDKKLARRADGEASDARSDAKKARKAADRLEDLNKDIRNLTERMEKEQTKLNKYIQIRKNDAEAATVILQKDSTRN